MSILGPYLVFEGDARWWYTFSVNDNAITIEKSPYTKKIECLRWQEHRFFSGQVNFTYAYDPIEAKSVCLIIDNGDLYRVPLHILPALTQGMSTDRAVPRLVISQVEKLNIVSNRIQWSVVNNTIASVRYPQININEYHVIRQNNKTRKRINEVGVHIREYLENTYFDQGVSESKQEDDENDLIASWDLLYPEKCFFVTQDNVPEIVAHREMYLWKNADIWMYRTEFLGQIIEGYIEENIWEEFSAKLQSEQVSLNEIVDDRHKNLKKILAQSYLGIPTTSQYFIISTLLPVWPIDKKTELQDQITRLMFLFHDAMFQESKEGYEYLIDEKAREELFEFKDYLLHTVDHYTLQFSSETSSDPHEIREKIANFMHYLLVANLRLLDQDVSSINHSALSNMIKAEGLSTSISNQYNGLSTSQSHLLNLILNVANPNFDMFSYDELLEYKYDLESIIDSENNYRDGAQSVADDALASITGDEGVDFARQELEQMCNLLIFKINMDLCRRIIFDTSAEEVYEQLHTVLRDCDELASVIRYLPREQKRILLQGLKPGYQHYFHTANDLVNILRCLGSREQQLLISLLSERLFVLINNVDDLKILFLSLNGDIDAAINFVQYVANNNKLYELITSFEDFISLIADSPYFMQIELIYLFRDFLKDLIGTAENFCMLLECIKEEAQIETMPILREELGYVLQNRRGIDTWFAILDDEGKSRLLSLLDNNIHDFLHNKEDLDDLIHHLNVSQIETLFSMPSFNILLLLPFFKDFIMLISQENLFDDKAQAIINGMKIRGIFVAYEEEIMNLVGRNKNNENFVMFYLTQEFLFQNWDINKLLFLDLNTRRDYITFVSIHPDCFWAAYSSLCQIHYNTTQLLRFSNTQSFWNEQEQSQTQQVHREILRATNWLLDITTGKKLFYSEDFNLYQETIFKTPSLTLLYNSAPMQQILTATNAEIVLQTEQAFDIEANLTEQEFDIEANSLDWLTSFLDSQRPQSQANSQASNEEDMTVDDYTAI